MGTSESIKTASLPALADIRQNIENSLAAVSTVSEMLKAQNAEGGMDGHRVLEYMAVDALLKARDTLEAIMGTKAEEEVAHG